VRKDHKIQDGVPDVGGLPHPARKSRPGESEKFDGPAATDARDQVIASLREALANAEERIRRQTRQSVEADQAIEASLKDFAKLSKWADRLVDELRRVLRSNRWRLGCWLSLKRSDSKSTEARRFAGLISGRPQQSLSQQSPPSTNRGSRRRMRHGGSTDSPASVPSGHKLHTPGRPKADVVICVHNALDDVRRCLSSVIRHSLTRLNKLILINDGSDAQTTLYLREFVQSDRVTANLLENPKPLGYTVAANKGLAATSAPYVILLNSDTVVTPGWIDRLIQCGETEPAVGIIGPLSNAASWQSVPEIYADCGDWAVNELPEPFLDQIACAFSILHLARYPKVPLVNGFCLTLKRSVLNSIGLFDEMLFPKGYGEENDYCLRAGNAGFRLAIADDCYVFHAKSKSYSHHTRQELSKRSGALLRQKYGSEVESAIEVLKTSPELEQARLAFSRLLAERPCSVLFLMNVRGIGGGINSIVQEANGLRALGVAVQIAICSEDESHYRDCFASLVPRLFYTYETLPELVTYATSFEFVVATLFTGVRILQTIVDQNQEVVPCYYIQDYEPSFFPPEDPYHQEALESYTLVPGTHHFAKTQWLCELVERRHGIKVHKVEASIDHDIFFADGSVKPGTPFVVCAMVRPMTERRSPDLTFEILRRVKIEFDERVEILVFGIEESDLFLDRQPKDFDFEVLGILNREGVAQLMRKASLFIDASTYQAFGRTGLEAMACGCATILPALGGITEYAVDRVNTLLAVPSDIPDVLAKVKEYIDDRQLYRQIVAEGVKTASRYSIGESCRSELEFFKSIR
jgi:GT2 family glycosyltransferase/glycosyltransferase involved in cell wall biosynthesis